ncbi:hypothetical protein FORC36_1824 [Vibrio vulnificus]|nr:hypothetical protein FORC36_1824 [Vibrio vulnificus]
MWLMVKTFRLVCSSFAGFEAVECVVGQEKTIKRSERQRIAQFFSSSLQGRMKG